MEKLNSVNRSKEKIVYHIKYDEFIQGDWLNHVPKGKRVKVEWTSGKGVLIIENTPFLRFEEYRKGDINGKQN